MHRNAAVIPGDGDYNSWKMVDMVLQFMIRDYVYRYSICMTQFSFTVSTLKLVHAIESSAAIPCDYASHFTSRHSLSCACLHFCFTTWCCFDFFFFVLVPILYLECSFDFRGFELILFKHYVIEIQRLVLLSGVMFLFVEIESL